jgi:hypothetical protein
MVRRVVHWASRWSVTLGALMAVVLWWAASVLPPSSFWFVARSMVVPDSVVGSDTVLLVDREIRRPVYGDWTVTVRKRAGDGWVLHCVATGGGDYSPLASLPDPLTLDWWTLDQCPGSDRGHLLHHDDVGLPPAVASRLPAQPAARQQRFSGNGD